LGIGVVVIEDTSAPDVGESTEEIPVVPDSAVDDSGRTDLFGAAGSLTGLRFNGRTLVRALVLAAWAVSLLVVGLVFYDDFAQIAPPIPRWWVLLCGMAVACASVIVLSDVDEPDVEDGTAGHEFHELDWSRKELYSVRVTDVVWALVELLPIVVLAATMWR
jgi:hypothetical protein